MPRPKPPRISAAEAGWPSISTSAIRIAVAASARPRNRRSMLTLESASGALNAAVDMRTPRLLASSRAAAELLLQVIPFGARGLNGAAGIAGPLYHRTGIEPGVVAAEQFVQDEPVGRGPVAG